MSDQRPPRPLDSHAPEQGIVAGDATPNWSEITPEQDVSGTWMAEFTDAVGGNRNDPILTLASGEATYFQGNPKGAFIDALAMVTDADTVDFDGATLVVGITCNGSAGDRLGVLHQGTGAGQVEVAGTSIRVDGSEIATFEGGTSVSENLVITFDADAHDVDVEAVARRVAFQNVSEQPPALQRTISMQLNDGDGRNGSIATRAVNVVAILGQ